jgi:voltage-gated potassium channel
MERKNLTEIVIGVLAVVSIVLVAVESMVELSPGALWGIYAADLVICIVFAADFIHRLRLADNRGRFWKTHGYEILAMIPAMAFYGLGAIPAISSALRSLRLIRVVRVIVLMARMRRVMSRGGGVLRCSYLLTMLFITFAIIFAGAFAVMILESETATAQITDFSDAVWWSISTVTTVGYGDIVPNTIAGRVMGMVLMVVGIGVMAAFISEVSAAMVESRLKRKAQKEDLRASLAEKIKSQIDDIDKLSEADVALLMQLIRTLRLKGDEDSPPGGKVL